MGLIPPEEVPAAVPSGGFTPLLLWALRPSEPGLCLPPLFTGLPGGQLSSILIALKLWTTKPYHMKRTNVQVEKELAAPQPAAAAEPLVPVEPATVTAEQLTELKERAGRADENWERLLRTTADFENFKKRAAREKQEAIKFANEGLLQKLLPVLENLDMALAATQTARPEAGQSLQAGVNMISQQLKGVLAEAGLEELDALGKPFDPNLHEALMQKETPDVPEGQVVQQLRKGYKFRDRLLRPAGVVVAKQPAA
jgi:molecular chaperone GrpE